MKTKSHAIMFTTTMLAAALPSGCALNTAEDADRFREAIPDTKTVALAGPETGADQSGSASTRAAADNPWQEGPYSEWYGFTRHVRAGVNTVTAAVLGTVWIVVHTRPTTVSDTEAIWGPHTDALEPATWQLRVREVAEDEYKYVLEGRPKDSAEPFRPVLTGLGYGKGHPSHGDGNFEIDLDVARQLDPFEHQDDSGKVTVTHDLPPTITEDLFTGPRHVTAEVRPSQVDAQFTASSHQQEDGSGTLLVSAHGDIDEDAETAAEDIEVMSQWRVDGAGRADITISGGDVPADLSPVTAVECWGSDFYRTYYADSIEYAPTEGDPDACAFSGPPEL